MRPEVKNIIDELELLFAGEGYDRHKESITAEIEKAEIRYQYLEQRAIRSYGNYRDIKKELAGEYGYSLSTIEDIIQPVTGFHVISV